MYGIAGILVVVAAVRSDPSKATGLDTALKTLAAQPYGVVLLVIVALGLAAFGVYCLFDARYRRAGRRGVDHEAIRSRDVTKEVNVGLQKWGGNRLTVWQLDAETSPR